MKRLILILISIFTLYGCSFEKAYVKDGRKMWKAYFQKVLKDPNSLVIYEEIYEDKAYNNVEWEVEYGAKNGFGGMVREKIKFETIGDILFVGDYGTYKKEELGIK